MRRCHRRDHRTRSETNRSRRLAAARRARWRLSRCRHRCPCLLASGQRAAKLQKKVFDVRHEQVRMPVGDGSVRYRPGGRRVSFCSTDRSLWRGGHRICRSTTCLHRCCCSFVLQILSRTLMMKRGTLLKKQLLLPMMMLSTAALHSFSN